jgi:hypothetical protein
VLKPKRIVGSTGPGVARIEGDGAPGTARGPAPDGAGDVIIGLNPGLSSSVAPRGIPPLPAKPENPPPGNAEVPEAVPVVVASPQVAEASVAPELSPEGIAPEQGLLLAVGSNGAGLSPPGERPVAPRGTPTGPTGAVFPGTPSGDVGPSAEPICGDGASWATLTPQLRNNTADAIHPARKATSTQCLYR